MDTYIPDSVDNCFFLEEELKELKLFLSYAPVSTLKSVSKNVIFLLEPTVSTSNFIPQNLAYLGAYFGWDNNYSFIRSIEVSDIQAKYNEGYRIFIAIQSATSLVSMIPWFSTHPDTFLISATPTSSDPIITQRTTKNIYRLSVDNTNFAPIYVDLAKDILSPTSGGDLIVILNQTNDNYSNSLTSLLQTQMLALGVPVQTVQINNEAEIPAKLDPVFASINNRTVVASSVVANPYRNGLHRRAESSTAGYFIEYYPSIPTLSSSTLDNRYNFILYQPNYERNVQSLENNFGITKCFLPIIDSINLAEGLNANGKNALDVSLNPNSTLVGTYGYLYFNATGDRNFLNFGVYKTDAVANWNLKLKYQQIGDTVFKSEIVNLDKPSTQNNILLPYQQIQAKNGKICFMLTTTSARDDDVRVNLQYMNYNYPIFEIAGITTQSQVLAKMLPLYNQGYRIFIGFDTTSLIDVFNLHWFSKYPDTVAISLYSTGESPSLRTNSNVYRLQTPAYVSYRYYINAMQSALNYNYIIEQGDAASEQLYLGVSSVLDGTLHYITPGMTQAQVDAIFALVNTPDTFNLVSITSTAPRTLFYNAFTGPINANFIQGGSTTLPTFTSSVQNYYFLMFNPPYERNVDQLVDNLGNTAALPLLDALRMATDIQQYGTYFPTTGSYGYTYFDNVGDRSFDIFAIWLWNDSTWSYQKLYNTITGLTFEGVPYTL